MLKSTGLLSEVVAWLESESAIKAAILFGSSVRASSGTDRPDNWADIDLHIITTSACSLESVNWSRVLPREKFCLQIVRPATGGVRKVTVLFASGQIDLVLVPASQIYLARIAMWLGLHRRSYRLLVALNEVHTCLQSGYRFLKGEKAWGAFYSRIMTELPGVRLSDREVFNLAAVFLCELLLVLKKLERGELAAAQYALHRSLAETNFRLIRELRLRRGQPLPSFGLARHVETSLSASELAWVEIDARLDREGLRRATLRSFTGLKALMEQLVPEWSVPTAVSELLGLYLVGPKQDS